MTSKRSNSKIPGWFMAGSEPKDYTATLDKETFHSGTQSALITHAKSSASGFGTLMQSMDPDDYKGKRWKMTFWIKTENIKGWAGGWMRVDGPKGSDYRPLSFDNMQDRIIKGTIDWTQYSIVLDVPEESSKVCFGVMLSGKGKLWIDDINFAKVSKKVPVTCMYANKKYANTARNLDFEESAEDYHIEPGQDSHKVKLKSLPVSKETKVNSISSSTETSITFCNKTKKKVKVYWIDFEGRRKPYGQISAGQTREYHTFATHPWLIANSEDKAIALFVATEAPGYCKIKE